MKNQIDALLTVHSIRDEKLLRRFANNVKKARRLRKMSQEDLAFSSGVALSQIARIETARINTSISTAHAILKALNVDANELFE